MEEQIKKFSAMPGMAVYYAFKGLGYTVVSAVSELIDNSISSFRKHSAAFDRAEKNYQSIHKTIIVIFDKNRRELIVRDTAYGIPSREYENALRIKAEPEDKTGLNEFGMGLKTSSFWLGDGVEIITRSPADKNGIYADGARMSLTSKNIKEGNADVVAEPFDAKNCAWKLNHGTVVRVTGIDRDISDENVKKCVQKIASKYRRDIKNNAIKIFVYSNQDDETRLDANAWTSGTEKRLSKISRRGTDLYAGVPLSFVDPKPHIDRKTGDVCSRDFAFEIEHDGKTFPVKGEVFVMIPGSRATAGFDLYRRGCIVVEKFTDFIPNPSGFDYQRIRGSLDLDTFPISQAKDKIMWEGELFQKVYETLRKHHAFIEMKKYAINFRAESENKDKDLVNTTNKFRIKNLNIGGEVKVASIEETIKVAEEEKFSFRDTDVLHKIWTDKGVKNIYSRLECEGMNSWMDIEEVGNLTIVRLDVNHAFFNPFNNLKENHKAGEVFINTMREFAVYWAWAEKESMSERESAEDFRERLSILIEENKGE